MMRRAMQQTQHFITKACSKGRKQCLFTQIVKKTIELPMDHNGVSSLTKMSQRKKITKMPQCKKTDSTH